MKKKTVELYDFSNWKPKKVIDMTLFEMIGKIALGDNEIRKDFIEKNLEVVIYAVQHFACVNELKQDDIDDLMTIGIFGVDKAINSIVKGYKNSKNVTNATIRRYVHLMVVRAVDRYFEMENKSIKTESYDQLVEFLENDDFDSNEYTANKLGKLIPLNDYDDVEYYEQMKQLSYLRILIQKSLKGVGKDELKMFFSVYPIDLKGEFDVVQDVVADKMGLREIGQKYGWTERQTINRMSKILRKLRTTAVRCGMVNSNPLNK